ncbi:hypothetical protein [Larkinella soli]|uniref:hypothetical protein n=1 Tax=Larkinella soli TaxID=1770527 RepID=UPI000FFBB5A9|nr:hypothetical protein [Larkinella soli]
MASQPSTQLINTTTQVFNGAVSSVSPQDGISLIDNWITAIRSGGDNGNAQQVAGTLQELKNLLQAGNPDTQQIKETLHNLASQTEDAAQSADEVIEPQLNQLAKSLRSFGHLIAGEPHEGAGEEDFMQGRGQIFTQTGTGSAAGNAGAPEMGTGATAAGAPDSGPSEPTGAGPERSSTGEGGGNSRQL